MKVDTNVEQSALVEAAGAIVEVVAEGVLPSNWMGHPNLFT